jgi:hypothetical protein
MRDLAKSLQPLVSSLSWFAEAGELRAMHVVSSALLAPAVVQHVAAMAMDESAPDLWLMTEAAPGDWATCTEDLLRQWSAIGQAMQAVATAGIRDESDGRVQWPALQVQTAMTSPDASHATSHATQPHLRFAATLTEACQVLPAQFRAIVLVLAPPADGHSPDAPAAMDAKSAHDATAANAVLGQLVASPMLEKVRWVVIDVGQPARKPVMDALGDACEGVQVQGPDSPGSSGGALLSTMMAIATAAAQGVDVNAGARPNVQPPQSPNVQPTSNRATQSETTQGPQDATLDAQSSALQMSTLKVLQAAEAARKQDIDVALKLQNEAVVALDEAGLGQQAMVMRLMAGSYLLQASRMGQARELLGQVTNDALAAEMPAEAVQAQLALASSYVMQDKKLDAAVVYSRTASLAQQHNLPVLAIEAHRLSGEMFADEGKVSEAAHAWSAALDVAEVSGPEALASNASLAGRTLAEYCTRAGLRAQADSVLQRVHALEQALQMSAAQQLAPEASSTKDSR